jgi:hypothetical protein
LLQFSQYIYMSNGSQNVHTRGLHHGIPCPYSQLWLCTDSTTEQFSVFIAHVQFYTYRLVPGPTQSPIRHNGCRVVTALSQTVHLIIYALLTNAISSVECYDDQSIPRKEAVVACLGGVKSSKKPLCQDTRWPRQDLFFLWLYRPILGLVRLRETFRFISVTRSRPVGRTP